MLSYIGLTAIRLALFFTIRCVYSAFSIGIWP